MKLKQKLEAVYNAAESHQAATYADGEVYGNDAELFGPMVNAAAAYERALALAGAALDSLVNGQGAVSDEELAVALAAVQHAAKRGGEL